jgi:hypothetical protein
MIKSHSKVFAVGICCLALVVAVFILNEDKLIPTVNENTLIKTDDIKNEDTDKDGLKDWEEELIGTNKDKSDTDSDGTKDGDEINQSRDPLKAGPNDLVGAKITDENKVTNQDETGVITKSISENFFDNYLTAKKNGVEINTENAEKIASLSLENSQFNLKPTVYKVSELKVSDLIDKKSYEVSLENAVRDNMPKNLGSELGTALFTQKESDLVKIDPVIKGYEDMMEDLLKITLPKNAVGLHLVYLNTISSLYTDLKAIRNIAKDPILGYVGLNQYQVDVEKLKVILNKYELYFR